MKIKVYRPINQEGFYHHNNDSFRELLEIWEELEYIELIDYEGKHVWMNSIGDVLLYDRPTLEWLEPDLKYNLGLFGNPELPQNGKNNHHWIFWARHPKILNQNIKTRKVNNTIRNKIIYCFDCFDALRNRLISNFLKPSVSKSSSKTSCRSSI